MKTLIALLTLFVAVTGAIRADNENKETPIKADDLSQFKTADELWAHIGELKAGPKAEPANEEEARKIFGVMFSNMQKAVDDFIKRFPDDSRKWEARMLRAAVMDAQANLEGKQADPAQRDALLKEITDAKDAPAMIKAEAALTMIQAHASVLNDSSKPEAYAAVDKEAVAFQKSYPDDPRSAGLMILRVEMLEKADPVKSEALLKDIVKSDNPELAAEAKRRLDLKDLMKKPLDLKFTSVDGAKIDLAKYRGKVVLVDFWATWCGPCRAALPHVLETYKNLHEKGFEIIGISLDKDKDKLLAFTKDKGMTWVQYYDGKVWENEISQRYGITGIPAMWLVDKKGMVRNTEAHEDLEGQVTKLLAE